MASCSAGTQKGRIVSITHAGLKGTIYSQRSSYLISNLSRLIKSCAHSLSHVVFFFFMLYNVAVSRKDYTIAGLQLWGRCSFVASVSGNCSVLSFLLKCSGFPSFLSGGILKCSRGYTKMFCTLMCTKCSEGLMNRKSCISEMLKHLFSEERTRYLCKWGKKISLCPTWSPIHIAFSGLVWFCFCIDVFHFVHRCFSFGIFQGPAELF